MKDSTQWMMVGVFAALVGAGFALLLYDFATFNPSTEMCTVWDTNAGSTANIHYPTPGEYCTLQTPELKNCFPCKEWQMHGTGKPTDTLDYRYEINK